MDDQMTAFDTWCEELSKLWDSVDFIYTPKDCAVTFKSYFNDDYTPKEVFDLECSYLDWEPKPSV